MADKLYYGWLLAYLSTSPNFGAGLVLKKLGPHTNLKTFGLKSLLGMLQWW